MAITWKNINTPNFASSNQLMVAGGDTITQGIDQLRQVAAGLGQEQRAENTARALNTLNQFDNTNKQGRDAFIQSLKGQNIDHASLTKQNQADTSNQAVLGQLQLEGFQEQKELDNQTNELFAPMSYDPSKSVGEQVDALKGFAKSKANGNTRLEHELYTKGVANLNKQLDLATKQAQLNSTGSTNGTFRITGSPEMVTDTQGNKVQVRFGSDGRAYNLNGNPVQVDTTIQPVVADTGYNPNFNEAQLTKAQDASNAYQTAQSSIDTLSGITEDDIANAGGASSIGGDWLPSSRGSVAKFNQIISQQFMEGIEGMRGMGSLSNAEGGKVAAARLALVADDGSLKTGLPEEQLREQLEIMQDAALNLQKISVFTEQNGREPTSTEFDRMSDIPAPALKFLRDNPQQANAFKQKYGFLPNGFGG